MPSVLVRSSQPRPSLGDRTRRCAAVETALFSAHVALSHPAAPTAPWLPLLTSCTPHPAPGRAAHTRACLQPPYSWRGPRSAARTLPSRPAAPVPFPWPPAPHKLHPTACAVLCGAYKGLSPASAPATPQPAVQREGCDWAVPTLRNPGFSDAAKLCTACTPQCAVCPCRMVALHITLQLLSARAWYVVALTHTSPHASTG